MTLRIYADVEQRSEAWHELRRGIVTASTVGTLITPKTVTPADNEKSRALIWRLAAERVTGRVEETYQSAAMLRGIQDEPYAREVYAAAYAPVTEVGFMTEDSWGFTLGASPDGLVGEDGSIEIKSREPKAQVEVVVGGKVPAEHMAQVQTVLLVSGRQWLDYVSICTGEPLWTVRVTPDERWQIAILAAARNAEALIAQHVQTYRAAVAGLPATERRDYDIAGIEF